MIQLQFLGGDSLSSRAIGWFSAGHLSHVDAVLPDGRLLGARSDKVGDTPPGVRIRPGTYAASCKRKAVFNLTASTTQTQAFYDFLQRQVGKEYDYEAILGFVFARDWRETDSWICSELIAAALEKSGVCPALYLAANKIAPVPLALTMSALGAIALS